MRTLFTICFLTVLCLASTSLTAQQTLEGRTLAADLDIPWEITWGPDGWIWVTERSGRISRVHPDTKEAIEVAVIPNVLHAGETGLLGMAVHREDDITYVYVVFQEGEATFPNTNAQGVVVRYQYNGTTLVNPLPLIEKISYGGIHAGSRLKIVGDKLFVTYGDAANAATAQDISMLTGKILRINLDGTVPSDNPFSNAEHPMNLLWSWGHRNPQGLVMGPNGILYSSEHGPSTDDEVNIVEKGRNYGWPNVEGYCDKLEEEIFCIDSNVVEPIAAWTPTLAVCGLEYYDGDRFPEWKNSLLLATLKEQELRQLKLSPDGRAIVEDNVFMDQRWGRLRDVCVSPDGRVFIASNDASPISLGGRVIELYYRDKELPRISPPQFTDSIVCIGVEESFQFTTEGEFEPDNVFLLVQIHSNDTGATFEISDILQSFEHFPGVRGGTFSTVPRNVGNNLFYRVISTNPFTYSDLSQPIDHYSVAPPFVQTTGGRRALCASNDSLSVTIANFQPDLEYLWSTGSTERVLTVKEPGTYTVTATLPGGCSSVSTALIIRKGSYPEIHLQADELGLCEGDSILLHATHSEGSTLRWSTGTMNQATIAVKRGGRYWAEAIDTGGCSAYSDTVLVTVHSSPFKPEITQVGSSRLGADPAVAWQWYRNDELMSGETAQFLRVTQNGFYKVQVFNAFGCGTFSDLIEMIVSSVEEQVAENSTLRVYPHPVTEELRVEFGQVLSGPITVTFTDIRGEEHLRFAESLQGEHQRKLSVAGLPAGTYLVRVESKIGSWETTILKR